MLTDFSAQLDTFIEFSKHHIPWLITLLGGLWAINLGNWVLGSPFNILGIFPRHFPSLLGIFFAPILHANFTHLLFNSGPLFFLALFVLTQNPGIFYKITGIIIVLSGFLVWLMGRKGNHIGASGLIAGYFGYLLIQAYSDFSVVTLFCAVVAVYYFGGILFSLFPTAEKTSWEGHLFGFLTGVFCPTILRIFYKLKDFF